MLSDAVGDDFQQATKYILVKMTGGYLDWSNKPDIYKHYMGSKKIEDKAKAKKKADSEDS